MRFAICTKQGRNKVTIGGSRPTKMMKRLNLDVRNYALSTYVWKCVQTDEKVKIAINI